MTIDTPQVLPPVAMALGPMLKSTLAPSRAPGRGRTLVASLWALTLLGCPADDDPASTSNASATTHGDSDTQGSGSTASESGPDACWSDDPVDTTSGVSDPVMQTWGAACSSDEQCVELLGAGAVCLHQAVIYELPGGYCSKPCVLPDDNTRVVPNDPACDPNGGVSCLGAAGLFEYCAVECTDDQQCGRDGYFCRQMPMIAQASDPSFCLMSDCCQGTCAKE